MTPPVAKHRTGPLVIVSICVGGAIAFSTPFGLMFMLRGLATQRQSDQAELESLRAESQAMRDDALRQIESEGFVRTDTTGLDRMLAAMRRSAERMNSSDGRSALNAAAAALDTLRPSLEAYAAALNRLEQAGGLTVESLPSPRRIDERLELIDALDLANTTLSDAYAAMPARFETLMLEAGIGAREASEAAARFRDSSQLPVTLAIRRTDADLCEAMRGLLRLLRARWGRWELDRASGMVMFQDDADVAAFNQWMARLQQITDEQTRLQRQVLGGS